jgi:hypothetical protein
MTNEAHLKYSRTNDPFHDLRNAVAEGNRAECFTIVDYLENVVKQLCEEIDELQEREWRS